MAEEKTKGKATEPTGEENKDQLTEEESKAILASMEEINGHALSDTYKVGRESSIALAKTNRTLFTSIEEKESGNYIIRGLERKVAEYDFEAFKMAFAQTLYNQSYQSGNTEQNSGISRKEAKALSKKSGRIYFKGEVVTSLNDLCRLAYGVDEPSMDQKKAMETLIDTLQKEDVKITFPNGDTLEAPLLWREKFTRKEDGAKFLHIIGHPIFCSNVASNFAEFPQNLTKQLSNITKRKTLAHYRLIQYLGRHDKRKPVCCNINTLLVVLRLEEAYKEQSTRTEKQLITLFEDMKKLGLLSAYEIATTSARGRKAISKVKFILNPDYLKEATKEG